MGKVLLVHKLHEFDRKTNRLHFLLTVKTNKRKNKTFREFVVDCARCPSNLRDSRPDQIRTHCRKSPSYHRLLVHLRLLAVWPLVPREKQCQVVECLVKRLCSRLFELCKIERSREIKEIITLSLPLYVVSQSVDHHHRKVRSKSSSNWFETWNRLNGFDFKVPRLLTRKTKANLNLILVQFPFSTFYACFEVIQAFRPICWSRLSLYRGNCKLPRFRHLPNNVWSDVIFDRFEGKRVSWLWSRSRIWRNLSCLILLNQPLIVPQLQSTRLPRYLT